MGLKHWRFKSAHRLKFQEHMSEENPEEKSKVEEEIKEYCQKQARTKAGKFATFLEKLALDDEYRDTRRVRKKDPKTGESYYEDEECPVSASVRLSAAKTWKEMFFDKAVGDVKEKAKAGQEKRFNMKAAFEAIAKAKAKEKNPDAPSEEDL